MIQADKDLLLKDLCCRLPYGVKASTKVGGNIKISFVGYDTIIGEDGDSYDISFITPYLFPLSSMTDELWDKEFRGCGIPEFTRDSFKYGCETLELDNSSTDFSNIVRFINQLIKHHFDIYGLIPMGLAINATGLNIY